MSIKEIKAKLGILTVLNHYGLSPGKNKMIRCPFHEDQKASMKVYEETGTVYCFAGSCKQSSLDVIDFIMQMDGSSKHEAILKAKGMIGQKVALPVVAKEEKQEVVDLKAQYQAYQKALARSKPAQNYCTTRALEWQQLQAGYKSRKAEGKWARGCLIFPLLDEKGEVVSLYGRSIYGKGPNTGRHYYMSSRSGLYPAWPDKTAKVLILTESVIDATTLYQLDWQEGTTILALYGTNGLTAEHNKAISKLRSLQEIIFALDADEAGRSATQAYAKELKQQYPHIRFSSLELPQGEDVNSVAVAHEDVQGLFMSLYEKRKQIEAIQEPAPLPKPKAMPKLDSTLAHNLVYTTSNAIYAIKGGIRSSMKDYDSLKVTLVIENPDRSRVKSRQKLDLYEDKQVEKASRHAAEKLGLRAELIELDIQALTDELESYRDSQRKKIEEDKPASIKLTATIEQECLSLLKQKSLLEKIDTRLEACGIIGEQNNRRLGFCIASSYGMPEPLHGLIQGSSGSGKTHLLSSLCALVPPEHYIPITRATDNSFYNYRPYELRHKLISVEDKDAMSEEANLAFRELQTKGMVSSSTTGQDDKGHSQSYIRKVYGPIASLACTTKGELYLDDMNRCFLLAVDESEAQTLRILDYQKQLAAGKVSKAGKEQSVGLLQNCLRLLKPGEVVIPYATSISLPEEVKDKRRLNGLYLALAKQITLLHQYQRKRDSYGRLISTVEDLKLANEVMFDAIVLKADELHGPLRSFYEKLKAYIRKEAGEHAQKYTFRQREVRQALRLSRSGAAGFIRELLEMEYVQISSGSEHRGYHYQVSYWDDNEALRSRIKAYLSSQLIGCT
jgi:DNA primase